MTTIIGRVGQPSSADLTALPLSCLTEWTEGGAGVVTLRGLIHATSGHLPTDEEVDRVKAVRAQLVGYSFNPDEQVVPVIWDSDSSINGFYRVLGASVDFPTSALKLGAFPFTVNLLRVRSFAGPRIESPILGAQITNAHGTVGESWFAFPATVTEQEYRLDCESIVVRESEDGDILFTNCLQFFSGTLKYFLVPENYYVGAARLEVAKPAPYDTTLPTGEFPNPLETIVGTQPPRSPYAWRLSNGLVRVVPAFPDYGNPYQEPGAFAVSWWVSDLVGWSEWKYFRVSGSTPFTDNGTARAGRIIDFTNITVDRNSPETIRMRVSCLSEFAPSLQPVVANELTWGRIYLDFSLRLGSRTLQVNVVSSRPDGWRVYRDNENEAGTVLPEGGMRATGNDADGIRYVLMTSVDFSGDTVNGGIIADVPAETWDFGIGAEIPGGTTDSGSAERLIAQYFSGQTEHRIVVAR